MRNIYNTKNLSVEVDKNTKKWALPLELSFYPSGKVNTYFIEFLCFTLMITKHE